MKKFSLAGTNQKITCAIIIVLFIIINLIINLLLPIKREFKLIFLIISIIISLLYVYIIFFSKVVININEKLVTIKMLNKTTIDLTKVEKITLGEEKVQNKEVKVIIFSNNFNQEIGKINTFFTAKQNNLAQEIVDACLELIH